MTAAHIVDLIAVCAAVLLVLAFAAVLGRQRHMLRMPGAMPMAVQRGTRWLYGVARYQGDELRWYRALGIGTRPSKVLRQGRVEVLDRRARTDAERKSLPAGSVVIRCRTAEETVTLAMGESAFTGLVSWLEASAPRW